MVRQESVLRESKVLYIESRLGEERKEEERKESTWRKREKWGGRTNREEEREREKNRDEGTRKRVGESTPVRRGEDEARGGVPEDGRRVVSTITNTVP